MPIVYMATNRVTGDRYIGVTKRSLRIRRSQHELAAEKNKTHYMPFVRALRKYGPEIFYWEILEEHDSYQDTLDGEVWWIALLEPEYNLTKGGQGFLGLKRSEAWKQMMSEKLTGRKMSEESRAKMSIAKKGKPNLALLGKPHSPERVEKARQLGLQNRDKWLARSWMGPEASSRAVKCLTDGEIYPSVSIAARTYGIHTGALSEHLTGARNRASVSGRKFVYLDGSSPTDRPDTRRKFTNEQVRDLRIAALTTSIYRLAKKNGVSWSVMRDLVEKRSYKHVSS